MFIKVIYRHGEKAYNGGRENLPEDEKRTAESRNQYLI
jgi:hypothetical protein